MISDPLDIWEQIRNSFCKSERGENFTRLCKPKNLKEGDGHQQFLLLAMKDVQVQ